MHKLLVISLMAGFLGLGLAGPVPAATMVEYGQVASQSQGGGAAAQKSGSWKSRKGSARKGKANKG